MAAGRVLSASSGDASQRSMNRSGGPPFGPNFAVVFVAARAGPTIVERPGGEETENRRQIQEDRFLLQARTDRVSAGARNSPVAEQSDRRTGPRRHPAALELKPDPVTVTSGTGTGNRGDGCIH